MELHTKMFRSHGGFGICITCIVNIQVCSPFYGNFTQTPLSKHTKGRLNVGKLQMLKTTKSTLNLVFDSLEVIDPYEGHYLTVDCIIRNYSKNITAVAHNTKPTVFKRGGQSCTCMF